jgi:hypothetical protein
VRLENGKVLSSFKEQINASEDKIKKLSDIYFGCIERVDW